MPAYQGEDSVESSTDESAARRFTFELEGSEPVTSSLAEPDIPETCGRDAVMLPAESRAVETRLLSVEVFDT